MDRAQKHRSFVAAQARGVIGGEELREQPACPVYGGNQSDQRSRVGHRCDKEWQDRAKGCKANRKAKDATIQHIDRNVIAQMPAGELFDFGEGEHRLILPSDFASIYKSFSLDRIPYLRKIKTNVRSFLEII